MGFNGKQFGTKGRTVAHIRDRLELLGADTRAGDVNAVFGHKFFVARQVDGGHRVLRSVAAAAAGCAENAERARQEMPRPTHVAGCEQLANLAAGNRFAAQSHLRVRLDLKTHLAPEFAEQVYVAGGFVAEAEVKSFVHFARVQLLLENALGKLSRGHERDIPSEGKQEDSVDSRSFEQVEFFGRGRQQL